MNRHEGVVEAKAEYGQSQGRRRMTKTPWTHSELSNKRSILAAWTLPLPQRQEHVLEAAVSGVLPHLLKCICVLAGIVRCAHFACQGLSYANFISRNNPRLGGSCCVCSPAAQIGILRRDGSSSRQAVPIGRFRAWQEVPHLRTGYSPPRPTAESAVLEPRQPQSGMLCPGFRSTATACAKLAPERSTGAHEHRITC